MDAPADRGSEDAPRVAAAGASFSLIVPIRLVLGGLVLAGTLAAGGRPRSCVGGFVLGTFFVAFAALADRRSQLLRVAAEPEPLPPGARREPPLRVAWRLMLPSTVVVIVLAVATLVAGRLVLAAILGGAAAGLGVAAAVTWLRVASWEARHGVRLSFEQGGSKRRFIEPR